MAKKSKEGAQDNSAPLFKWVVIQEFYDLLQGREVKIGEEVEHTEKREKLKLIELK